MNRQYTREWYIDRVNQIRHHIPDCGLSTDAFCGFSTETEDDFLQTLGLMKEIKFDSAFMFKYSVRPGTIAAKKYKDDVPESVKIDRLNRMIDLQNKISLESNQKEIGKVLEVLTEGFSKKSNEMLYGRSQQNKVVVFAKENHKKGDIVKVKIDSASQATLKGKPIK